MVPALRPGQVDILDKLSVHCETSARTMIEAAGGRLLFLASSSPNDNPIEQRFTKLKARLRRSGARTCEKLWAAIGAALSTITAADARPFFAAGGYRPSSQLL